MTTLVYLCAAAICAGLALRTGLSGRHDPVQRAFLLLGLLVALCYASFTLTPIPGLGALRTAYAVSGGLIPAATWGFFSRFFDREGGRVRQTRGVWIASLLGVGLFVVVQLSFWPAPDSASPAEVALGAATLAGFLATLHQLWREHQNADKHVVRVRIRYLGALLLLAASLTAMEQLARSFDARALDPGLGLLQRALAVQGRLPPMGALLGTLFIYVLHLVVQLYRLVDINELLARLFVLLSAALLLVGGQGLFLVLAGDLRAHPLHGAFQMLLAALLFLATQEPLMRSLQRIAADWFNRPGRRLLLAIEEAEAGLAQAISLDGLSEELLRPLLASGRLRLVSLYLWEQSSGSYRLHASRGAVQRPLIWAVGAAGFVEEFRLQDGVLQRAPGSTEVHSPSVAERTLGAMDAELCLAFRAGPLVLGWLNLKAEPGSEGLSKEEVRRLGALVARVAVTLQNIHSFRAMEEQHRLAALGTMAAGLAHEIRNPLAGIKGAAQYLQGGASGADPEELREFLGVIVDETDRLAHVVSQFLDYSRPYVIHPERVTAGALLARAAELCTQAGLPPGLRLQVEVDPATPTLEVDADKLHQVLLNLLRNAVDAVGARGEIWARARPHRPHTPGGLGEGFVEISVQDDGPGIPEEQVSSLFTPFFTTKPNGTGLGLAISRRIVEAHGGELRLNRAAGRGCTFTLRLPAERPRVQGPPEPGAAPRS